MSKESVLICDRCEAVIRGSDKSRDAQSDLIVQVRADIGTLKHALGHFTENAADPPRDTQVTGEGFVDLCDECRDDIAEHLAAIFKVEA